MTGAIKLPVLWDVAEEHLGEAAFLYEQWKNTLHSPLLSPSTISGGVEERLLAHVDALLIGGWPVAERLLLPVMGDETADPEMVWAAAFALLQGGYEEAVEAVLSALDEAGENPCLVVALGRAVELADVPLERELVSRLHSASPLVSAAALQALATRRVPLGDDLDDLIASESPELSSAALAIAWRDPTAHRRDLVERKLFAKSAIVQEAALRAGLLMNLRIAWDACVRAATDRQPSSGLALTALAMGGTGDHLALIERLLAEESLRVDALFALGFSGRPSAVEACLPWLADRKVGGIAGEAFSAITGLQLKGELKAAHEEEAPWDGDLDANLVPGPEADLPRPDPERVASLWANHRARFRPEHRYVGGQPLTAASLELALKEGTMRRRPSLALEFAIRTRSEPLDTRRWVRRQFLPETGRPDTFHGDTFEKLFAR